MRAYSLRGEVGGGWALEFERFLNPLKWHRADRRVPFRAQKTREVRGVGVNISEDARHWIGLLQYNPSTG